ncbi:hypothetical protein RhiirA5_418579 [Rhizophagus irregularis]|uniref:Uncharacterized protein n=1 Tax=Rhizophagus irregularis TaxID=588596 RepID=A0A2N0PJZ3_9GLOM|nr:hypothetical protein RhiirA5_418579 [Rhizophagus irregularis]
MHLETTMIISTESPQQLQFGISSSKDGLLAIHNAEKVHASDGISCTNKNPLNIRFSESALKEGSGGGVKLEAGDVELLKDRVDVEREKSNRSRDISKYRSNRPYDTSHWTRLEMGSYTKCHDGKDNKAFDIRIPEFSYGVILAGFSEVTA